MEMINLLSTEPWVLIVIIHLWIIFDAISQVKYHQSITATGVDGKLNLQSHIYKAVSYAIICIGLLFYRPTNPKEFLLSILYILLCRFYIFDLVYNKAKGLPIWYVGNNTYIEKIINKIPIEIKTKRVLLRVLKWISYILSYGCVLYTRTSSHSEIYKAWIW